MGVKKVMRTKARYAWYQWYPDDWMADQGVRACGLAARGLWRDLLDFMQPQRSETPGVLPGDPVVLSRLIGAAEAEVAVALTELERWGVLSRGRDVDASLPPDAIVCRRIWRTVRVSRARSEAGRKSGESRRCGRTNDEQTTNKREQTTNKISRVSDAHTASYTDLDEQNEPPRSRARSRSRGNSVSCKTLDVREDTQGGDAYSPGPRGIGDIIGDVLANWQTQTAGPQKSRLQRTLERVVRATGSGWEEYWNRQVRKLSVHDGFLDYLDELLAEVERSRNPRKAHEHGFRDPGGGQPSVTAAGPRDLGHTPSTGSASLTRDETNAGRHNQMPIEAPHGPATRRSPPK